MNLFQDLTSFLLITFLLFSTSKCNTVTFRLHKKVPDFQQKLQFLTDAHMDNHLENKSNLTLFEFKLANFNNSQYVGEIYIGSNQQKLDVIFDTGSHFLVVPEPSLEWQFSHTFNCNLSKTCQPFEDQSAYLKYGSGSVYGYVADDQVSFGNNLKPTKTSFVIATEINKFPNEFHADGVLGLRKIKDLDNYFVYPNAETIAVKNYSIIDNMKAEGKIEKRQFSFFLGNDNSGELGVYEAEFTVGGYNKKYIHGNFSYFNVIHGNYWGIQTNGINVDGVNLRFSEKGIMAVIDSGTSLITLPKEVFSSIIPVIKEKTGCEEIRRFMCLCSDGPCNFDPEDFPTITFEFNGFKAVLPGKSYVINIEGYNVLEIIGLDMTEKFIILGDPFMRQYVTIFDEEEEKIGLAKSVYYIEPKSYIGKKLKLLFLFVIVVVSLILGICFWKQSKKKDEENIRLLKHTEGEISMTVLKS